MKDFIRNHIKALAIFFIVFIVAIPLLINFAFKVSAPIGILFAEWDAGNALAFYGVIVASFSTVVGVYLSIEYSQKNLQADTKNRVQPYLFLSVMDVHNDYNPFLVTFDKAFAESTPQKSGDEPIERYIRPIALKMGQTLYLHIFSVNPPENMLGEYELEFQYEDIIGTKYLQKYPVSFARNKNNYIHQTINLNSAQQER